MIKKTTRSSRDAFGEVSLVWGDAVLEEAAGGREFGGAQDGADCFCELTYRFGPATSQLCVLRTTCRGQCRFRRAARRA